MGFICISWILLFFYDTYLRALAISVMDLLPKGVLAKTSLDLHSALFALVVFFSNMGTYMATQEYPVACRSGAS